MKTALRTLSALLILIVELGVNSGTVESAVLEGDDAPQPCRDLSHKKPKVWPTLRAQPRNGQYRLIQVNWDVDEVLDGDWLGVFSDDPTSISSDDLKYTPQTTSIPDVTTSNDNSEVTFETIVAKPRDGGVIRDFSPRKGRKMSTEIVRNESTVGLNSSSSNSTLGGVQDGSMSEVTEQPLQTHRKVRQKNKKVFKGKRRKIRMKIGRKSQHPKRKFRNRESNESGKQINSNSSTVKHGKNIYGNQRNEVNVSANEPDDDQFGSWRPEEPSLLTPAVNNISYFNDPKFHLKNKQRQETKAHYEDRLGHGILLTDHSSTTKALKMIENEEKNLEKKANSNEDHTASLEKLKSKNGVHLSRVSRDAKSQDKVTIITDKDEESRFGGGFFIRTKNDKPILSTSSEEEHRFGGGVGVSEDSVKERITFITDPNEENRFGGGLGIIPNYSSEDTDKISLSEDKEKQDELEVVEPTVKTLQENYSETANEEGSGIFQNELLKTDDSTSMSRSESSFTTLQPQLDTEMSPSATESNESEGLKQNVIHNIHENVSQSFEMQSRVNGHKNKAERTGMNGDFFRGLQDSYNNDFNGNVTVNNDRTTEISSAATGPYSHSKETQGIESKTRNGKIEKSKKQYFRNTGRASNHPMAKSESKSKANSHEKTKINNITLDSSITVETSSQNAVERSPELESSKSNIQKIRQRFDTPRRGEMQEGKESIREPKIDNAGIVAGESQYLGVPDHMNSENNRKYQKELNANRMESNSLSLDPASTTLENHQDQMIQGQLKQKIRNLPKSVKKKLENEQVNPEVEVTRQSTISTPVKHEIGNVPAEKVTSFKKLRAKKIGNITRPGSNYRHEAVTTSKKNVGNQIDQERFFISSRSDIELKVKYEGYSTPRLTNVQLNDSSNEELEQFIEVKSVVAPEEKVMNVTELSNVQNSLKLDAMETAIPINKKYLPIDLTVEMENSDKNEVYFPIDLTVETGNSPEKSGPHENHLRNSETETSSVQQEHVTRTPTDWESIITTDTSGTTREIESSTLFGRLVRNNARSPLDGDGSFTTDIIEMTTDVASPTQTGAQLLTNHITHQHSLNEGSTQHDFNDSHDQHDSFHLGVTSTHSLDHDNENNSYTDYKDNDNNDYHVEVKETYNYDEPYRNFDINHSDYKLPRNSRRVRSNRGSKHHDYDFHNFHGSGYASHKIHGYHHDYDSYHGNHGFHGSGYASHKSHGYHHDYDSHHNNHGFHGSGYTSHKVHLHHHKDHDSHNSHHNSREFHSSGYRSQKIHVRPKEHHDNSYMYAYEETYDDYPEYKKYEDDYYDEYYATGSEPAKDVVIKGSGKTVNRVDSVLRDEGNSTTPTPEVNVEPTESPYLDDVKIGDGNFLTDLRIDSGNITKNLTNPNDFILITNGTNENEITIIASDLNTESNSVVKVVTSFSDKTNTSTIVLSTNDDRDPSRVVISGLEVRPSAILVTGGSHSPNIVVKNARSVPDVPHSSIRFKRMKESILYDILDCSMILRWYPVQNLSNFEFEVNGIAELFKINKQFHISLKEEMGFDFISYENRIARADKFRSLLKQKHVPKFMLLQNEKYALNEKERYTQKNLSNTKIEEISTKSDLTERAAHVDYSEIHREADYDFNDDLEEDNNGQSEQLKEEEIFQPRVKYRQNSKILDYPTDDADAPFIIKENLKNVKNLSSSQNVMILKPDRTKPSQTGSQEMKFTQFLYPGKQRSSATPEAKEDIPRVKLMQKPELTTTSIIVASSKADQIAATTQPIDYFEETTFPSYGRDSVNLETMELATEQNFNTNDRLSNEFSAAEMSTFEPLEELHEISTNRSSRMHNGQTKPGVGWSQYHPWVKFSALPTSSAGKITSTVQHARVPSSQLSEGGCVGNWVAYIRRGEVLASACLEAHPAWMWDNRDVLIDRPLEDLALLGSHNAGSLKMTDSFDTFEAWVVCQDETILDQLLYGVRHLDIRLGYYPDTPEKLWINHDAVRWAPFSTLLDDVLHFTKLSPDLVVLDIHRTPVGFEDPQATVEVLDAIQNKLADLLYPYPSDSSSPLASTNAHHANWNQTREATEIRNATKPQVTLGDIWTAGRSVIVCWGDRGMRLNNPWLWPSVIQEWADAQLKSDLMSFLEASSQRHSSTSAFWALMAQLTPSFWDVVLRSSVGIRGFTDRIAGSVDKWLENSEWLESGSIIAVDFFHSTRMVNTIIDINIARAACPDVLHQRVLDHRMHRVLSERVINQWKFTIKNGTIFVENEDEFNYFSPESNYGAQNDSLPTRGPVVGVEVVSATRENSETTTPRASQILRLSVTGN
ncbi:PLC-like phosphodiesterase TIM beta/alpha-barrel domain [Trinorchestia longiramus]|nr:PLC-like phosphodiesterase TIM beta/alpha-barrel domain [Trinorchestia longiramus]